MQQYLLLSKLYVTYGHSGVYTAYDRMCDASQLEPDGPKTLPIVPPSSAVNCTAVWLHEQRAGTMRGP
jgi:hypothetical protein